MSEQKLNDSGLVNLANTTPLEGLDQNGDTFKSKRNDLLRGYKEDYLYCLSCLSNHLRNNYSLYTINYISSSLRHQPQNTYISTLAK